MSKQTGERQTSRVYAVVLAAGRASRFGSTKQLASYRGEPLVRRALRAAESVCGADTILVVGHDLARVHEAAAPLEGFLRVNERYEEGLGTSIASAARVLPDTADAALFLLADQPRIEAHHLDRLIERWRENQSSIVCSSFGVASGPPVVFPADLFPELALLDGDTGARGVLERNPERVIRMKIEAAATDVDTPGDLAAAEEHGGPGD